MFATNTRESNSKCLPFAGECLEWQRKKWPCCKSEGEAYNAGVENVINKFEELVGTIARVGSEAKSYNPEMVDRYKRKKILETQQTPIGIRASKYTFEDIYKPTWHRAVFAAREMTMLQPEYHAVTAEIRRWLGEKPNLESFVMHAVNVLIGDYFDGRRRNLTEFAAILKKDILGEPVLSWSEVEVRDLELLVQRVELSSRHKKYVLRQIEVADLVEELPDYPMSHKSPWDEPSCLLRIEMPANVPLDLQKEAMKVESAFRLFEICSFTKNREAFHSESVAKHFGGIISGGTKHGRHTFQFKPKHLTALKMFWADCLEKIPREFYDTSLGPETFLRIAYARYCDALFYVGKSEGKIALAVMGLEAMFLGRDERDELKYRLSLRMAKVFSKVGWQHEEVRVHVRAGYDIRSIYVHGGHLSAKERTNYEKKVNLTIEDLAIKLLDALRVSILFVMLSGMEKDKLLVLLEASFLTSSKDAELESVIGLWKRVLVPSRFFDQTGVLPPPGGGAMAGR